MKLPAVLLHVESPPQPPLFVAHSSISATSQIDASIRLRQNCISKFSVADSLDLSPIQFTPRTPTRQDSRCELAFIYAYETERSFVYLIKDKNVFKIQYLSMIVGLLELTYLYR